MACANCDSVNRSYGIWKGKGTVLPSCACETKETIYNTAIKYKESKSNIVCNTQNYSGWARLMQTEMPAVTNDTGQKTETAQNTGSGRRLKAAAGSKREHHRRF